MPVIDLLDSVNQKFNNVVSGLTATNAKAAIDEVVANIAALTKSDVGLGNVDNTSDLSKPISTATQTALDGKATTAQVSNVDNTSDLNKPVSTATQTALDDKVDDAQVLTNVPAGALFTDTIYSHPTGDGNLHVPANGVSNDGKVLTASAVAGVMTWETPAVTYVHPSHSTTNIDTTGATIVDAITTTAEGHISAMSTRVLTLADLGYTGETNATADQTAAEILAALLTVDGVGSGLDADTLDGVGGAGFLRSNTADILTAGSLTLNDNVELYLGSGNDFAFRFNGSHSYGDMVAGNFYLRDNTTTRFTFARTTGSFTATGNVTAYSDVRVKKNLEVIPDALGKVELLNGYTFDRTDMDVPRQTGVIAQEVQAVLPEAVTENEDGKLAVAYGNMMGLAIEAIKELKARVEELEGR